MRQTSFLIRAITTIIFFFNLFLCLPFKHGSLSGEQMGGEPIFAQNTFRYKVCPDISPLRRWVFSGHNDIHQVASDSGYIVFGQANNDGPISSITPTTIDSFPWTCFSETRLDKYGNIKWIRAYQEFNGAVSKATTNRRKNDGIPTSDSGYAMAGVKDNNGYTISGVSAVPDSYTGGNSCVQKTGKDGNLQWAKMYKVSTNKYDNEALQIRQMPDAGFIVMGRTKDKQHSEDLFGVDYDKSYDTYLLRLDKNGGVTWSYRYDAGANGEEYPLSLEICADGGFIVAGYSGSIYTQPLTSYKAFMMKVSSDGATVEWSRRYGSGWGGLDDFGDYFYDTKQTPDKGYISVGTTKIDGTLDIKGWVVKTDEFGKIVWQKTYNTFDGISKVEVLNDGYLLGSNEFNSNNSTGSNYGRLTKINISGEVQWSKLYDLPIADMHLTMDQGFIMTTYGPSPLNMRIPEGNTIIKTNSLGEFDMGCVNNSSLSSWVEPRIDSLYNLTPIKIATMSITNLNLFEATIISEACPVVCNISDKPFVSEIGRAAPRSVCANTIVDLNLPDGAGTHFAHYKVDFGDPASGPKNFATEDSVTTNYESVSHNYSDPGTYNVTYVIYNNDYSESDTILSYITVVAPLKNTILTPQISVCKNEIIDIEVRTDNYVPGYYVAIYGMGQALGNSLLSKKETFKGDTLTTIISILHDESILHYDIIQGSGNAECLSRDTVRVIRGKNKAIIKGNENICKGGTAILNASGGDNYLWSTGATTKAISVNPSSNKTYWVQATTASGCIDTAFVYVKVAPGINVEMFADRKVVCEGEIVNLNATGASSYSWSTGDKTDSIQLVSPKGETIFVVTGTSGLCSDTDSIVIKTDTRPNGSISSNVQVPVCSGSTFQVTASGGEAYYWHGYKLMYPDNPSQTFTAGNNEYAWVLVYNGACADTVESFPPSSVVYSPSIGGITADRCRVCPGTEVTLRKYFTPQPGYISDQNPDNNPENQGLTYKWSTGETKDSIKINVSTDTLITLTTTNNYGCKTVSQERVQLKPNFFIKKEASAIASCGNTPTTLYVIGEPLSNFDYDWGNGINNDTLVVSPLNDSMLYVTASVNGCSRKDSVFVYAHSTLPEANITGNALICKGTPTTYTVTGSSIITNYRWLSNNASSPTITLSTSKDTTIKAELTFQGGCKDTAEYKIKVKTATVTKVSGNTQICPNGTTELTASGGYTYQWNTGSTNSKIKISTPKDSLVKVIINNIGCSNDTLQVNITTNKTIKATLYSDEDIICTGTALTLIAGGGDAYTWNTGQKGAMLSVLAQTTTKYEVKAEIKDDNCSDTANITITVKPAPTVTISGQSSVCEGKSTTLQADGNGTTYLWSTGETNSSISVNPVLNTSYSVTVFNGSCMDTSTTQVTVIPTYTVNAGSNVTIIKGASAVLSASTGGVVSWWPIDGLDCNNCLNPQASPVLTTTYYVTTEAGSGCTNSDSVTIYVIYCAELFVPNAFSPNSDNVNDVLYIKNDCIKELEFKIYDRWGNKVFESTDVANGWDGSYLGKNMNADIFVYSMNALLFSGEQISRKGNICLMR